MERIPNEDHCSGCSQYHEGECHARSCDNPPPNREHLHCSRCGSLNVEATYWVRPNHGATGEVGELFHDLDCSPTYGASWCADCEDHTILRHGPPPTIRATIPRSRPCWIVATVAAALRENHPGARVVVVQGDAQRVTLHEWPDEDLEEAAREVQAEVAYAIENA